MTEQRAPGLYVHVPFCRSKCRYCGFFSVTDPAAQPRWLEALDREARVRRQTPAHFDTVYVGGGSPSVLDDDTLELLIGLLIRRFDVASEAEVTIEVNPADVTLARARRWRSIGFNRVSVGVQSFIPGELRWLGRRHDPEQAGAAVRALRSAGFDNVGIDLLQGLPHQSVKRRLESLGRALTFHPEHLSCYELTVEADTLLSRDVEAGLCALPDTEAAADAYLATAGFLRASGYDHYEVSNFARSPALVSQHNSKYWDHTHYLGLGPAAHSFDGSRRWSNVRSVADYCTSLEARQLPIAHEETLDDEQLRWERVALGLRTAEGLAQSELDPSPHARAAMDQLVGQGLVRLGLGRVQPTVRGMVIADALARRLLLGTAASAA